MKRDDFCFTIGYNGEQALVDKQSKARYGKMSVDELLAEGLYKPAFCAAVFDGDDQTQLRILAEYNRASGSGFASPDDLKRVFGVFGVPEGIKGIKAV
jgi:hypothetical protein